MVAAEGLDPDTRRIFTAVAWASFIILIVLVIYDVLEVVRAPNLPVGAQ